MLAQSWKMPSMRFRLDTAKLHIPLHQLSGLCFFTRLVTEVWRKMW